MDLVGGQERMIRTFFTHPRFLIIDCRPLGISHHDRPNLK
jgi:hypothetical protein